MKENIEFKDGFIYVIFDKIMKVIYYLNLVEFFKYVASKITKINKQNEKYTQIKNNAIDIFIITKWLFVFVIWMLNINNVLITAMVIYLITTNLFTYFYYHVWDIEALDMDNFTVDRIRNRFKNLLQAFSFSIYSFAYLFQIPLSEHFSWTNNISSFSKSILFSAANSITAGFEGVVPNDTIGNFFAISEILITFIFIAIIFTKSIPQTK
ncbi:MAG: hypothetical protein NTU73_05865 [Ignavibacteriae bacterium]|nr:hypothetical protein [Ignavibacteriota bacterium]